MSFLAMLTQSGFPVDASTGSEIHSLTLDGNILKITCSDAMTINLQTNCRMGKRLVAEPGQFLNERSLI